METEMLKCPQCTVVRPITDFQLDKRKKCNICKEKQLAYDAANKEKAKERRKKYREANLEKLKAKRREAYQKNKEKENEQAKKYHLQNKEEINKRHIKYNKEHKEEIKLIRKNRYHNKLKYDSRFKIDMNFSKAVRKEIKRRNFRKQNKWEEILGYTVEELVSHLESLFKQGMTWDNYGTYWHIDHIKPKSWFLYESMNDDSFKECWSLSNLQPLEAIENSRKGNRYEG